MGKIQHDTTRSPYLNVRRACSLPRSATNANETDMERCIRAAVRDCAAVCRNADETMNARKEIYGRYLKTFEGAK